MSSLRPPLAQLRGRCQTSAPQWQQLRRLLLGTQISPKARNTRLLSTIHSDRDAISKDDFAALKMLKPSKRSETGRDEFDVDEDDFSALVDVKARPMPASPSYFSRQAEFNDSYLLLLKLMRKYSHLPTVPSNQVEKVAFKTLKDYRLSSGQQVKASEYARCMTLVKRLHKIHPDLKKGEIVNALGRFKRDINPYKAQVKAIHIDRFGRSLGVGKRKTSVARAWVVEGTGEVYVNGKSLSDAFGRVHDRESAVWALKATARTDKYNVWALVNGGGTTGQAEAMAMAVGKALMAHEPALKPALRRAGVVTRDPRGVERKKHGHLKARKKPAWVKR